MMKLSYHGRHVAQMCSLNPDELPAHFIYVIEYFLEKYYYEQYAAEAFSEWLAMAM